MDESFQPARYISDLAEELVMEFARGARATTPGLVGGAREVPVRKKLESLLPPTVSVGSGCIIDSYGHTSRQIDVVIYEKNICPCFYVNDSIDAGYYPCEGVIAVGERAHVAVGGGGSARVGERADELVFPVDGG